HPPRGIRPQATRVPPVPSSASSASSPSRRGGRGKPAVIAGSAGLVAVGALLAGCSGYPPAPSSAEVDAISIPSPRPSHNASSSAGACGLLTDGEIEQETGAAIDRTSTLAGGCVWQHNGDGGMQPVVDIRVKDDIDGDIARVYNDV